MARLKTYFLPKTLTWWIGLLAVALGLLMVLQPDRSADLGPLAVVIAGLVGASDASPVNLILMGLGLIGIRAKMERP